MTQATSTIILHAPAGAAWQAIRDFSAAAQYLVRVVNCTVEGAGVGALPTPTSPDGSSVVERLEAQDDDALRLSYALLTDTPFRNCLTTIALHDLGWGQCQVSWSATFEADGLPENEAQEMLAGTLAANCLALKQFLER